MVYVVGNWNMQTELSHPGRRHAPQILTTLFSIFFEVTCKCPGPCRKCAWSHQSISYVCPSTCLRFRTLVRRYHASSQYCWWSQTTWPNCVRSILRSSSTVVVNFPTASVFDAALWAFRETWRSGFHRHNSSISLQTALARLTIRVPVVVTRVSWLWKMGQEKEARRFPNSSFNILRRTETRSGHRCVVFFCNTHRSPQWHRC